MIGNPLGLVDKLGTGVFELFSEPKKGLLQGPQQFVGGVGKGVQSLTTNVVSGGTEFVGNITGSVYGLVKRVGGDENTTVQKPDNAL